MARRDSKHPSRAIGSIGISVSDLAQLADRVGECVGKVGFQVIPYSPTNISSCLERSVTHRGKDFSIPGGWIKVDEGLVDNRYPRVHMIVTGARCVQVEEMLQITVGFVLHRDVRRHQEDTTAEAGELCLAAARELEAAFPKRSNVRFSLGGQYG